MPSHLICGHFHCITDVMKVPHVLTVASSTMKTLTMKLWMGSSKGCDVGLPGHVLGAGTGQPNCGCASWAVSVQPSLGSLQPPCNSAQIRVTASSAVERA